MAGPMKVCAASVAAALMAAPVCAAPVELPSAYPSKPIRFIVPFAPGAATDLAARIVATALSDAWGRTMLVDNRPGAGGNIGTELTAKAAPDGYTVMLCTLGSHAITPARTRLPYDHSRDFSFVIMMGGTTNVLVGNPSQPYRNVGELAAYSKANPGKLSYGSPGVGTGPHMSIELFKYMTGADIVHVSYKGAAPALTDVLGGNIELSTGNLPGALLSAIRAGKVRALGVTTAKRSARAPDIPTFAEGGVPGYDVAAWYGICAPAAVPSAIVDKLNAGITQVLNTPDVRRRLDEQGIEVAPSTPQAFAAHVKAETAKWSKVVKAVGLEEK